MEESRVNVAISGAAGRMGHIVKETIDAADNMHFAVGFDQKPLENSIYDVCESFNYQGMVDVVIDFSHPSALQNLLKFCLEKKVPVVIATTGLNSEHMIMIEEASKEIPILQSSNMSLGVAILKSLVKQAAKSLAPRGFDIEILEKHHRRKKDAPSGTTISIAKEIQSVLPERYEFINDRNAVEGPRGKNEIGMPVIRGGSIVGEHEVFFCGEDEIIAISHEALSPKIFALGAVMAANYLLTVPPGIYSIENALGL